MSYTSDGNTDIRTYIQNNWNWLALLDTNNNELTRIEVGVDNPRSGTGRGATWSSGSSANPLEISMTVQGGDSDMPALPLTIKEAELYKGSSATAVMTEDTSTDATLEDTQDKVDITIQLNQN